jgi:hypothetical protein
VIVDLRSLWHRLGMRHGVLLIFSSLVVAAPAAAHVDGGAWTVEKAVRLVDGKRLRVGTATVLVDADTTLCSGEGRGARRRGDRVWTHFRCTFTTFRGVRPGRDVEFRLHALDVRRLALTNALWVRD